MRPTHTLTQPYGSQLYGLNTYGVNWRSGLNPVWELPRSGLTLYGSLRSPSSSNQDERVQYSDCEPNKTIQRTRNVRRAKPLVIVTPKPPRCQTTIQTANDCCTKPPAPQQLTRQQCSSSQYRANIARADGTEPTSSVLAAPSQH